MIVVAIAALIGGRLYPVIDQWPLYAPHPITRDPAAHRPADGSYAFAGFNRPRRPRRDHPRHDRGVGVRPADPASFWRWADVVAPGLFVMQAIGRWGNFLQPGAVRPADDPAMGHPDRRRASRRPVRRSRPLPWSPPRTSIPCSCTSPSPASSGALVLVWLARRRSSRLVPGDLLLIFFVWYGLTRFRPRGLRTGKLDLLRHPTAQIVTLRVPSCSASSGSCTGTARAGRRRWPSTLLPERSPELATSVDEDDLGGRRRRPPTRKTTNRTTATSPATATPTTPQARPPPQVRPATRRRRPPRLPDDVTDDSGRSAGGRRRPPPGRVAPQALADARGGAVEGLAWLGRRPESRASLLYRCVRLLARFLLFGVFRIRIETSGQEHLPTGGYLLVGAAHRGWMDPFLVVHGPARRAAGVVPRQRSVDVHDALARGPRPSARRASSRCGAAASARTSTSRRRVP